MSDVKFESQNPLASEFTPVQRTTTKGNIFSNPAEARSVFRLIASIVLLTGIGGLSILTVVAGYKTVQIATETNEMLVSSYASPSIVHHTSATTTIETE